MFYMKNKICKKKKQKQRKKRIAYSTYSCQKMLTNKIYKMSCSVVENKVEENGNMNLK